MTKQTEFNLSEKIGKNVNFADDIAKEDVKEFIKRLKEETTDVKWLKAMGDETNEEFFNRIIDNLAGEKLK